MIAATNQGGRRADYGFVSTMDTEIRRRRAEEVGYGIRDVWIDPREAVEEVAPMTLGGVNARVTELTAVQNKGRAGHAGYLCFSTTMYTSTLLDQEAPGIPENMGRLHRARDATRNGDDSYTSGTGAIRPVQVARECTYPDLLKCQPLNFKGTEGVVRLTQWFEKMESVYSISNCTVACQVKFATCTLQGNALTWWNSHVKTTTPKAAHAMPWLTLKKMMTDKYCPRAKLRSWSLICVNLKVKGTKIKNITIDFATETHDKKINNGLNVTLTTKESPNDTARITRKSSTKTKDKTQERAYARRKWDMRPYRRAQTTMFQMNPPNVNTGANQRVCFECGAQGHFKRDCPKLKNNNNQGNRVGNAKAQAKVYAVGNAGANPDNNVIIVPCHYYRSEKIVRIPFGDEIFNRSRQVKGKLLEDVPVVQNFLKSFFDDLRVYHPLDKWSFESIWYLVLHM
ncbi:putative reverse transcriptase domain-containing protein [Tanacetum coccineum]